MKKIGGTGNVGATMVRHGKSSLEIGRVDTFFCAHAIKARRTRDHKIHHPSCGTFIRYAWANEKTFCPPYPAPFKRDYKPESKGQYRATLNADLSSMIKALANDEPLKSRHHDHALTGE